MWIFICETVTLAVLFLGIFALGALYELSIAGGAL
jgi:hypothetical protein